MKINSITGESNNTLKLIRSLHRRQTREKERRFLLEGPHCLVEACNKKIELKTIVASRTYLRDGMEELGQLDIAELNIVEDKLFEGLTTTTTSCGVLAVAAMPPSLKLSELASLKPRIFAVADGIQDPGNLGTLVRTAYAAQLGGLLVLKGSVDIYNPKVVRAAAGALFALPIIADIEAQDLVLALAANKIRLIVCEASAQPLYFEANLADEAALVLGNEGQGINPILKSAAAESISIPMNPESESLNVAVSGGIILFESMRQRLALAKR